MHSLPPHAPETLNEAFAFIGAVRTPTLDDLKLMVILEAASKCLYDDLATGAENADVKALLIRNGREELAHAHRVSRAIGKLTGTDYPVPSPEENPYLANRSPSHPVTHEMLRSLSQAEVNGGALYAAWAQNCDNDDVATIFRQNGAEESDHGDRLLQAAELLGV